MAESKGIAVLGDIADGRLLPITAEGLGIGRQLADDLDEELSAILVGESVGGLAQQAIAAGADRVYVVETPLLKDYNPEAYVAVLEKVIGQAAPRALIMGQTDMGRDLAPRVAFRLNTVATLDSVELAVDSASRQLLVTKPVYGGNALAVYTAASQPQVITIRTKAMSPLEPDESRSGEVITVDAGIDASVLKTKVVDRVVEDAGGLKIEDADVVVSGGRGIGNAEGFAQLEELAKALRGAVGASRPACDNGWMPDTVQVGLTGKIIAPDLYIAVAISGSSQHMSGCSGSKAIIAINRDPEANIFRQARFGVVGDWKKVLPAFTEKVKELLAT